MFVAWSVNCRPVLEFLSQQETVLRGANTKSIPRSMPADSREKTVVSRRKTVDSRPLTVELNLSFL